ncbi:aromatic ring-hydroxylating dioxygenase subunit alpha [Sandaracinobacter sp. RS1-74]|uniref:aromatic ring-hydroxylating oxygenase subunit alpha n=1 Tax=Sandaracinobacteroides sayramensis TaxID=2913411 RepID=UPI001EDC3753|nr:aromatic ring-hydroxylating dioxygenase subunit alpha [Sandaracinobacteroides sayramensis]MCG2840545.1 aromatic ring-hydroxylating dioxygenase subunit alpha [Sandaracinobacteroides sayramensis]
MASQPQGTGNADDREQERHVSHQDIRRRTIAHMRAKTTDLAAASMPIDPAAYTDPERFEAERRELFRKRPILAGLTGDIPNAGDKLLFDVLGPPILLIRNKAGEVNAFLNMCPHRAARLVTECNSLSRMTCRFHGWTFDLDGRLIGLPGKEGFADMERDKIGLLPVPVVEWHGMIFVRADPGGDPIDIEDWLGDMAAELRHLELEKAVPAKSGTLHTDANWKYAFDTYGESYHFATLHPTTIGSLAFSNTMTHRPHGLHTRLGFPRADFAAYANLPEEDWPHSDYGGLYMIFPNTVINVNGMQGGGPFYGVSRVFPGDEPGKSVTLMTHYRPGHADPEMPMSAWEATHDFIHAVVRDEDYSVSAEGQRNLGWAPPGFRMRFGANEAVLQKQHRQIAEILDAANEG